MELDWTTFGLEILNFLVLVWILKRFLYKPVLDAIAQRKAGIERSLAEATRARDEAKRLQDQYEHRLADWRQEKEQARAKLGDELRAERGRRMEDLHAALDQEREKAKVLEARRLAEQTRQAEAAGIALGGQFVARLLSRLAGPDLEARLVDMTLEDLGALSEDRRRAIRDACARPEAAGTVTSAHPLTPAQRQALIDALQPLTGKPLAWTWAEDRRLLAGLRISIGPWVLRANLLDELQFFTEAAHGGRSSPGS